MPETARTAPSSGEIDEVFAALPLHALADAALDRARGLGAQRADFRIGRVREGQVVTRDLGVEGTRDSVDEGLCVRVLCDGGWGFASAPELSPASAQRTAEEAVALAGATRELCTGSSEVADEPPCRDAVWSSAYEVNPFTVPEFERILLLQEWSAELLRSPEVHHTSAKVRCVQENKFYADLAGTTTTQQRLCIHPQVLAIHVDPVSGDLESMRSLAPPVGRGWEYVRGTGWDWDRELAEISEALREKVRAPSVSPGSYDLVIGASNLWLTVHESIGHATELDRALGYEVAYAGSTFATPDKLGSFRYGPAAMHVTADRTTPHGLATVGFDDEGVPARSWDLVRDGVLVGYQTDRRTASIIGLDRSTGCAYAETAHHAPIQRMANVSLQPAPHGPETAELIADTRHGLFVVGDRSWSIDMQRHNFQFSAQRVYRIERGRLQGQVRGMAYQSNTADFWGSLVAIGGPGTYVLAGADYCGKGQPGQIAAASHGCPSALFRRVRVLNTAGECDQ
jgi:TldD protein